MLSDQPLVKAFETGDREAFAQLIGKYQNYVASVAYCATGDFSRSEDIAQQVFVTAWEKRSDLRDPSKWLSWLRGITRNLLRNEYRRRAKESKFSAQADMLVEPASDEATPVQRCINREQSELLWSILEQIPESYRVPLVLYYREGKSVSAVADFLEVGCDVVKQRLARGRKLVKAEIAQFVEDSLYDTRPSSRLTGSVLAALPTASKSALTKAGGSLLGSLVPVKFLLLAIGPLIGIAGAVFGSKRSLDSATSGQERAFMWKLILTCTALVSVLLVVQLVGAFYFRSIYRHPLTQLAIWGSYAVALVTLITYGNHRIRQLKLRFGTEQERRSAAAQPIQPVSCAALRWNAIGAVVGISTVLLVASGLALDGLFVVLSMLLIAALCGYVWFCAHRQRDPVAQLRFNGRVTAASCAMVAVMLAVRWDFWFERISRRLPGLPGLNWTISGWMLGLAVGLFGAMLYAMLRWQAAVVARQIGSGSGQG